jgi:hypothetical protein
MNNMTEELYESFQSELSELTRLLLRARAASQPVATDRALIAQSQKVDALVARLTALQNEKQPKNPT